MTVRAVPPSASIAAALAMSAPGDTVELRGGGTHAGGARIDVPGVTLAGAHGDVVLRGRLYATPRAAGARVTRLTLVAGEDGGRANPVLDADGARLDHCVVDNEHRGIAVSLGAADRPAVGQVVEHNVIRDVGRRPWTNLDHGVYLRHTIGAVVRHNRILDGGDYGIHLHGPNRGPLVEHNLVAGGWAGAIIISGFEEGVTSGARIRRNVFVGPPREGRAVVHEWWDEGVAPGDGNLVEDNVVWAAGGAPFVAAPRGHVLRGNVEADPRLERRGDAVVVRAAAAAGHGPVECRPHDAPTGPPPA